MKIEIDLNDILTNEFGPLETMGESVKRQVVEKIESDIKKGLGRKIDVEISKLINDKIAEHIESKMPQLIDEIMDQEYVQVDRWGDRKREPTTFRTELIKQINEQMTYKEARYGKENIFTKAVQGVVQDHVNKFKQEFNATIDRQIVEQTLDAAVAKLKERLKIR